jgi:mercuric ion transport protein
MQQTNRSTRPTSSAGRAMLRVELVYDRDCPNVDRARAMIAAALGAVGAAREWIEWDRDDAATPLERRAYGSPTVLVNGRDVGCDETEAPHADAKACRVYMDECGCLCGAPSSDLIIRAIKGAQAA